MGIWAENGQNDLKVYINISEKCKLILESDILSYSLINEGITESGFINRIFKYFYKDTKANLIEQINRRRFEIEESFKGKIYSKIDEKVLTTLKQNILNDYIDNLNKNLLSNCQKGSGKYYKINKENATTISKFDDDLVKAYSSLGLFFKVMLEEYATFTPAKRERIYLGDVYQALQNAIDRKHGIRMTQIPMERFVSRWNKSEGDKKHIDLTRGEIVNKFYIKPYKIVSDESEQYLYLLGLSNNALEGLNNKTEMKPIAYRLAMIDKIDELSYFNGFISKEKEKEMNDLFSKNGPLMGSEEIEIVIEFSESGLENFKRISYGRPKKFKRDENNKYIYTFYCPLFAARNYFWRLMPNIKVISPQKLGDTFKVMSQKTLEQSN